MKKTLILLSLALISSHSSAFPMYLALDDDTKSISSLFGYRLGYYIYKDQIVSKIELPEGDELLKVNPHDEKKVEGIDNYSVKVDTEKKIIGIYGTTYFSDSETCLSHLDGLKKSVDKSYSGTIKIAASNPQFIAQYIINNSLDPERMAFGCTQKTDNKYKLFISSFKYYEQQNAKENTRQDEKSVEADKEKPVFSQNPSDKDNKNSLNSYTIL